MTTSEQELTRFLDSYLTLTSGEMSVLMQCACFRNLKKREMWLEIVAHGDGGSGLFLDRNKS